MHENYAILINILWKEAHNTQSVCMTKNTSNMEGNTYIIAFIMISVGRKDSVYKESVSPAQFKESNGNYLL